MSKRTAFERLTQLTDKQYAAMEAIAEGRVPDASTRTISSLFQRHLIREQDWNTYRLTGRGREVYEHRRAVREHRIKYTI